MARKPLSAIAALATFIAFATAGGAAHADDITMDTTPFMSQKSRAEVQAEVLKARAAGDVGVTEIDLTPTMAVRVMPVLSRDSVRLQTERSAAMDRAAFRAIYPA